MNTSAGLHGCYEYDGLKLLRVDEVYDSNSNNDLDDDFEANGGLGNWRTVEASTYGPGIVGNLLGKVVYTHTDNDATPDSQADYYYHYDHVGNVYLVTDDEGEEVYRFSQDAFGNELDFGNYTGDSWATAAAAGIAEHQTGKWIDDFSGLYFFHARWYDSGVGRFVSRDPIEKVGASIYSFCYNKPVKLADPTGLCPGCASGDFGGLSGFRPPNTVEEKCDHVLGRYDPWNAGEAICKRKCAQGCYSLPPGTRFVGFFISQCLNSCKPCIECFNALLDFAQCMQGAGNSLLQASLCLEKLKDCKDVE
jgi:RHS repeat-associated protein